MNGQKIEQMDMGFINRLTEQLMKVIGKMIYSMGRGKRNVIEKVLFRD